MAKADKIARHLSAFETHLLTVARGVDVATRTSAVPDAVAALREAFAALDGGAAVAGEAAGPWVVAITVRGERRYMCERGPASPDLEGARRWDVWGAADWAAKWGTSYHATVLPLAEAERMEAAGITVEGGGGKVEIADCTADPAMVEGWNDAGGRSVLVRSGVVVASAEWGRPGNWAHWLFPDGRQGGVTTTLDEARAAAEAAFPPEPPKPAGWVVRSSKGILRWLCIRAVDSYEPKHEPFATREDAQRIADVTGGEAVPVDAAGNVIEALPGVAWEAARAGEEAERLRGELAAVKAERDKVLSNAAVLDTSLRRLRTDHATTLADRDALAAEVARLKAILECGSSPYGMHRCCHCDSEVT